MSERRKTKAIIESLAACYEAPRPAGKRAFFRALPPRKISVWRMLLVQLGYLSRWVWLVSAFLFFVMLSMCLLHEARLGGGVFGLTPFLVLVTVTEISRSLVCRMEELEAATVCSLPGIVMARMLILGAENLLSLCVLACFMEGEVLRNLVYMLTPYLMTAAASLASVRRMHGRDPVTGCGVIAACVCLIQMVLYEEGSRIYEARYLAVWIVAFVVSAYLTAREVGRTVRRVESL